MEHSDIILGIESSCDDTSAAVIRDGYLLSNVIASQQVHKDYGGVVPELASRAHQQNIIPVHFWSELLSPRLSEFLSEFRLSWSIIFRGIYLRIS